MQSQDGMSTGSIYISASEASLEVARLVATQLEGEGYVTWIGDHHTDYDWPNIQKVVDDALRFADAHALVVIDDGDPNKIEAAKDHGKLIFFLKVGESLTNLLTELNRASDRVQPPSPRVLPRPLDPPKPSMSDTKKDGAKRQRRLLILAAVLLNVPLIFAMVSMYPVRLPTLADWIQLLILPTILAVSSWAYSDLRSNRY